MLNFKFLGSSFDQCTSKNGFSYVRENGENGCYYFHSRPNSTEYDYNKSKEYCEGITGASGSLPIIKDHIDNSNMLHLLSGYVSELHWLVWRALPSINWYQIVKFIIRFVHKLLPITIPVSGGLLRSKHATNRRWSKKICMEWWHRFIFHKYLFSPTRSSGLLNCSWKFHIRRDQTWIIWKYVMGHWKLHHRIQCSYLPTNVSAAMICRETYNVLQ